MFIFRHPPLRPPGHFDSSLKLVAAMEETVRDDPPRWSMSVDHESSHALLATARETNRSHSPSDRAYAAAGAAIERAAKWGWGWAARPSLLCYRSRRQALTKGGRMTQAARFRELMRRDGMVVAPGAYDCITARLIERAGFDAVYMTGAGTAATLGLSRFRPRHDVRDGRQRRAHRRPRSSVPVIADADTGYGNELNVVRTVREYEARRGRRHPYRGPGLSEEMRPSRRQGDRAARGLARQDPRRRRGAPQPRLHGDRPHRRARRAGFDEAIGARQRRARRRRRHGVSSRRRRRSKKSPRCRAWCAARACSMSCAAARRPTSTSARPSGWATSSRSSRAC